jgi:hypothetical protein
MQVEVEDDNDIVHTKFVGVGGECTQMATWWFFAKMLNKF